MKHRADPLADEGAPAAEVRKANHCAQHGAYSIAVAECPRCRAARTERDTQAEIHRLAHPASETPKEPEMAKKSCGKHRSAHMGLRGCSACRVETFKRNRAAKGAGEPDAGSTRNENAVPPALAALVHLRAAREDLTKKLRAVDAAIEALTSA